MYKRGKPCSGGRGLLHSRLEKIREKCVCESWLVNQVYPSALPCQGQCIYTYPFESSSCRSVSFCLCFFGVCEALGASNSIFCWCFGLPVVYWQVLVECSRFQSCRKTAIEADCWCLETSHNVIHSKSIKSTLPIPMWQQNSYFSPSYQSSFNALKS